MEKLNKEELAELRFINENPNNIQLTKDIELRRKLYILGLEYAEQHYLKIIEGKNKELQQAKDLLKEQNIISYEPRITTS